MRTKRDGHGNASGCYGDRRTLFIYEIHKQSSKTKQTRKSAARGTTGIHAYAPVLEHFWLLFAAQLRPKPFRNFRVLNFLLPFNLQNILGVNVYSLTNAISV